MGWHPPVTDQLWDSTGGGQPTGAVELNDDFAFDSWETIKGMLARNEPVGDVMPARKPPNVARFLFNNKRGFPLYDSNGGELFEDCKTLRQLGVDYAGFQEANLDTNQSYVKKRIHAAVSKAFDHRKVTYGSSPQVHLNDYKPGGTLALVMGRTVGRVVESGADYLGRWTRTVLSCKDGKRLAIYNAYTVCDTAISRAGDRSVIAQLHAIYVQEDRPCLDPRRNHYDDLQECIK